MLFHIDGSYTYCKNEHMNVLLILYVYVSDNNDST